MVSVYGYLNANFLTGPRATFAFAEQGDFPQFFAAVHPQIQNPSHLDRCLRISCGCLPGLAGSFTWQRDPLSGFPAFLLWWSSVCSVPVLRRKQPGAAWLQLPGGPACRRLSEL